MVVESRAEEVVKNIFGGGHYVEGCAGGEGFESDFSDGALPTAIGGIFVGIVGEVFQKTALMVETSGDAWRG